MRLLPELQRRELIVVTGKGGVGKTTLAGALGAALAARGRRALVLETDPRESLHQLFDVVPSGGAFVTVNDALTVQNLRPRDVLDALVREQIGIGAIASRVLASPVYAQFAEGAPGLRELAVLGHVLRVRRGLAGDDAPRADVVVLDAPATGHGLSLLEAPRLVSSVIADGPFGEMAGELAGFVDDRRRCGVVVVAAAEEMPTQEALELLAALDERLARRADGVVVNGLYPADDRDPEDRRALDDDPALGLWRRRRAMNDRELARLGAAWDGPLVELPLLALDRGPALVRAIVEGLEGREPVDEPVEAGA